MITFPFSDKKWFARKLRQIMIPLRKGSGPIQIGIEVFQKIFYKAVKPFAKMNLQIARYLPISQLIQITKSEIIQGQKAKVRRFTRRGGGLGSSKLLKERFSKDHSFCSPSAFFAIIEGSLAS